MSLKLFEISAGMQRINDLFECGELDEQTTQDAKEYLIEELKNKGSNIIALTMTINSEIEAIEAQEKRLAILKKQRLNRIESIEKLVAYSLEQLGVDKVVSPLGSISFRNSETVEIKDISKIRSDLVKTTITQIADKIAIKQVIKNGGVVEGVEIVKHKHLQIK